MHTFKQWDVVTLEDDSRMLCLSSQEIEGVPYIFACVLSEHDLIGPGLVLRVHEDTLEYIDDVVEELKILEDIKKRIKL